MTLCAFCQLNLPLARAITRFDRWFCDDACAWAWKREVSR